MGDYNIDFKKMVVDAYKSRTCSVAELAKKYNVSSVTIYRWVKKDAHGSLGVKYAAPKKAPNDTDWAIVKMYQDTNLPVVRIAEQFGVSGRYVYRALSRCGVEIVKRDRIVLSAPKYSVKEQAMADYATGKYGCRALAKKYGVHATTIARWVKEDC